MSDSNSSYRSGGMGLFGWLTVLFVFLKLNPGGNFTTPVADWSWWLVFIFVWLPFLIVAVILAAFGIAWLVAGYFDKRAAKKRRAAAWARIHSK